MDERDGHVVRADVGIEAQAGADQVVDLARGLDAAVAAAHHDKGEIPAAFLRVIADLGLFHLRENVGAQDGGVADGLQRVRMVGHARHHVQVGNVAAGQNHVVVVEQPRLAVVAFEFDPAAGEVDVLDLLGAALHARQELAERHDHVVEAQGGADRVSQQRAEDQMVLLVEEDQLGVLGTELVAQGLGALHAAEAAADDDNPFRGHGCDGRQRCGGLFPRQQRVRASKKAARGAGHAMVI